MKESGTKWNNDERYIQFYKKCCETTDKDIPSEDDKKILSLFIDETKLKFGSAECLLCNWVESNPEVMGFNMIWHYLACRMSLDAVDEI